MAKVEVDETEVEKCKQLEMKLTKALAILARHEPDLSKVAPAQQELLALLRAAGGVLSFRDIQSKIRPLRYGATGWSKVYDGLKESGWISETGTGIKGDPVMVYLLKDPQDPEGSQVTDQAR